MKIGIVTLVGNNYGNRLQNYALQEYIKALDDNIYVYTFKRNYSRNVFLGKCKHLLKSITHPDNSIKKEIKRKFSDFNKTYITFSKEILYKSKSNRALNDQYDYFVAGSDQVWNPFYTLTSAIDFLTFADRDKRISYAASMGVSDFSEAQKDTYRNWLLGMKSISVREKQAKTAIESLTGKSCRVHLDPTMLLDKKEWGNIESKPSWNRNEQYILVYFLGDEPDAASDKIKQLSSACGLEVIYIYKPSQGKQYVHDPAEFIWLIHHAKMIFTDSFHGSVFSLIFGKDFTVFERLGRETNTGSRIEFLLHKFNLYNKTDSYVEVHSYDREKVVSLIEKDRQDTRQYLCECFNIKQNRGNISESK